MAAALPDFGKMTELRQRLLFLLGALVVFRIGTHIPVPGIDPHAMAQLFDQQRGTILDMFNMFSGGALRRRHIRRMATEWVSIFRDHPGRLHHGAR